MFRYIILSMICLLILTACQNNIRDTQPGTDEVPQSAESDFTEFELTKLELDIPFNPNFIVREDSGFVLKNGNIVIKKFGAMWEGRTFFYYHYIFDADGKRIYPKNDKEKYDLLSRSV